jgi:acetyl-CoA acetyltransferase
MNNLKDTCAIVGIGETKFGTLPGATNASLNIEACKKAVEDSGLAKDDIDGFLCQKAYFEPTFLWSTLLGDRMGLSLKYTTDLDLGGATPVAMVQHAVMAINAGLCSIVVCTFGEAMRSGWRRPGWSYMDRTREFEEPFGLLMPTHSYSLACKRHMYEYGTTSEQLGAIAIACRKHASMNDNAQQRKPITIDDYLDSRMVCDPFRLLDICQVTDGGAAVVVTSADRARGLKHAPIYVSGMGNHHTGVGIGWFPNMTTTGAKASAKMAFEMADVTPKDIDVAEIYDCFTYTVLVTLEDYGFCKKGEGGPFVESGRIELGGELPVNTHGGLLSQGHVDGMNHITEAVKQLRGDCGLRQVDGAEVAVVSGNGGDLSTHTTLILRR